MDAFPWLLVVLVAVGIGSLWSAGRIAVRSGLAAWWPTVVGRMERVELKSTPGDDCLIHLVEARYRYAAGGQDHVGSVISFGYLGSSEARANLELYDHLKGASLVRVRYNPRNPGQATLSCGMTPRDAVMLGIAATFVLAPVGILLSNTAAITAVAIVVPLTVMLLFLSKPADLARIEVLERHT